MIIMISRTKFMYILITTLVLLIGLMLFIFKQSTSTTFLDLDEELERFLESKTKSIFEHRNMSLLKGSVEALEELYNKEIRNSLWAYEHELRKMKYLHKWSEKQGIEFKDIKSNIIIRSAKEREAGYSLNLLVNTEYIYEYVDSSESNSFRIGTYHAIDIIPSTDAGWIIGKEWYTDPFADSMHLDDIKSQQIKELILSGTTRDFSDINERRINAVSYVDRYSGAASLPEYGFKYNPKYRNYNNAGGDCANFASQMLYEGAQFKKNRTWNYERGAGSKAWLNAHAFNSYMLNSGRASVIARGTYGEVIEDSYKLLPGDYVAYEKKGKVTHISIVTGADSKGYTLVNSHNTDRHRVPWDLGWSNKGIKFQLIRVHY